MPARVLYLSYLGGLGGGETSLLALLRVLNRDGFEPWVICSQPGLFVQELQSSSIPVHNIPYRLPYFRRGWIPSLSPSFFWHLWNSCRANSISLIHCNDVESTYYAAPVARALGLPIVWTCWGWWYAAGGWKGWFYQNLISQIITPTEKIKADLTAACPPLAEQIAVIPFGVDTCKFSPGARPEDFEAEFLLPPRTPVVTMIARFQAVKGHEYFLEAALQILERFPDTCFLLVGDNPFGRATDEQYRKTILDSIDQDERLRSQVVFTGFRQDIPRLLRGTDVVVCSSLFESFGMVLLEAMACAVPVVSTNVGGPAETVLDGVTGFLVPPRDPETLADRVIHLLENPELRMRMGASSRRRVEEKFALAPCVVQVENAYRRLLKSEKARALAR